MSGVSIEACLSICRLRTTFVDSCGDKKVICGTGFWIKDSNSSFVFITNQHNLDFNYRRQGFEAYELKKIEIELRDLSLDKTRPIPNFFPIKTCSIIFRDADVVALREMRFENKEKQFTHCQFSSEWLADNAFFEKYMKMAQEAFFLGFPHSKFDEEGNLPVSGHVILASWPTRSFKNKDLNENDVLLIQGKALKGASGSPVITFPRGLPINTDSGSAKTESFCPQKLVGIIAGHFFKEDSLIADPNNKKEDFFNHSDYSYFIRSTSILYLLKGDDCQTQDYEYQIPSMIT